MSSQLASCAKISLRLQLHSVTQIIPSIVMQKLICCLLLFAMCLPLCTFGIDQQKTNHLLVSVAPYKFFVEKIAGDKVKVGLMVPAGASAHTYEPTPKEMLASARADAWFLIGESFETRAVAAIQSYNPQMQLFDLRKNVALISADSDHTHYHQCSHHNCMDLHIWLSPRQAKVQAATIAQSLKSIYPEHSPFFQRNLDIFLAELDQLDQEIQQTLKPLKNRLIMVSHPAYAYFCRDYQLEQLSIEFEGKDPTPKQLTRVVQRAKENLVKKIFVQAQYSNKGARLIANQIGAQVVNLDPYSEHYLASMRQIAEAFAQQ